MTSSVTAQVVRSVSRRRPPALAIRLAFSLLSMAVALGAGWSPARAAPLDVAAELQQRDEAMQTLAAARQEVAAAQAETQRTRHALDAFLASHFEAQKGAVPPVDPDPTSPADTKLRDELDSQLAQLKAKRTTLLETLTEEHPEVVEVSAKIEGVESRLAALDSETLGGVPSSEHADSQQAQRDADEYARLQRDWRVAQQRLDSARLAESAAADNLTAISNLALHRAVGTPPAAEFPKQSAPPESPARIATSPAVDSPNVESSENADQQRASRTQTLALASLALAVMLAALAAVRLARATSDPLFASADEVAAALAVPVVGIVPFGAQSDSRREGVRRTLLMLAQIAVALVVFCGVAYAIINLDGLVRFFQNPVATARAWFGL